MRDVMLIYGGKSTGSEIYEVARGYYGDRFESVYRVIGDGETGSSPECIKDRDVDELVSSREYRLYFILSMSNQAVRYKCMKRVESHGMAPLTITHPTSYISPSARIGSGVYVAANASISSNATVHGHSIINYHAVVGHDVVIGRHVVINPGAVIGGRVTIGERVLVGANAFIMQGKSIGNDTSIDALTYIDRDIGDRKVCSSKRLDIYP